MYSKKSHVVIGFHGCDEETCNKLINSKNEPMNKSERAYDWLGSGMYFWEDDLDRAFEWAVDYKKMGKIEKPAVVGAVIDLGSCLDFMQTKYLKLLKIGFDSLEKINTKSGNVLPENKDFGNSPDLRLRYLDCAVINNLHSIKGENVFDSVRGVFLEGNPVYKGSGFKEKNHIQICIRNPNCIKGYFLPREFNESYCKP